jgi:hypothetical protein
VKEGRFPERAHLVEVETAVLDEMLRALGSKPPAEH